MLMRAELRQPDFERGFTLVELMVTLTLLSLLLLLAMPSFSTWVRNTEIRSTAEALQNGIRVAKAQAAALNRQVVLTTTNATPGGDASAVVGGRNWSVQVVPLTSEATVTAAERFLEGGNFASSANSITVSDGPATLCFSSLGRLVANAAPSPTSPTLPACTAAPAVYNISRTGAVLGKDRPLRVTVSMAGQVRMCDPARTLSPTAPDGCPPWP